MLNELVLRPHRRRKKSRTSLRGCRPFSFFFILVMTTFWPTRVADFVRCQLLIMRTAQQFPGFAWPLYERAFRNHAAANKLNEWSHMNPKLFHFHVSGGDRVNSPALASATTVTSSDSVTQRQSLSVATVVSETSQALGTPSSHIVRYSWNAGRCSSLLFFCSAGTVIHVVFQVATACITW